MPKANIIHLTATPTHSADLADFLTLGGSLVERGEPATLRWYALSREGDGAQQAIFDVFPDQAGRQAHFDGEVAAALAARAGELVEGGWPGVLAQVSNMIALAEHRSADQRTARKANFIRLQARPGKAAALREFLIAGGDLVAQTEPQTLYWAALESEDRHDEFAIFDLFANQAGREAHFSGVVAAALADRAEELIIGGWQGVLAEVVHFDVHTGMSRN